MLGNHTDTVIDDANNAYSVTRDSLGRVIRRDDPDLGNWRYTYDANNNVLTQTDAKNQTLRFAYDPLDRPTTKTYPDNSKVSWSYDDPTIFTFRKGRVWKITDPSGSTTFSYDQRGRQRKIDKVVNATSFSTQYTYDSLDRVVNMTYPDGEMIQHTYNLQGVLEKLRSTTYASDYITNINYNLAHQPLMKAVGNGLFTAYWYNTNNFRLNGLVTNGLQDQTYTYDSAGNITNIYDTLNSGTQSFSYDRLHRLTSASSSAAPSYSHAYTYSSLGNMESGANRVFSYPASGAGSAHPHAPTSDGVYRYTYDANGNVQTRTSGSTPRTYTWDYDNRLAKVDNGAIATYTYDYAGRRVVKQEGPRTTLVPFPHYRTVNGAKKKHYFALGERIAERDSADTVFYYHPDHLGSSSAVTNSAGVKIKSTQFYPFGARRTETGFKPIDHKFTGQELDTATGLYYYGARYYDAEYRLHFLSPDPVEPNAAYPQTLNRYAYVGNNPVNYIDPTGNVSLKPLTGPAIKGLSKYLIERHHTVPTAILDSLPTEIANHPKVRGVRGNPNIWPIPKDLHRAIHLGKAGGPYNDAWIRRIGEIKFKTGTITVENILQLRNEITKQFEIDIYKPNSASSTVLREFGSVIAGVGIAGLEFIDVVGQALDPVGGFLLGSEAGRGSDIVPNVMRNEEVDPNSLPTPWGDVLSSPSDLGGRLDLEPADEDFWW